MTYFPMIQRYEASIYMLGWGVPTFDALYSLQSLVAPWARAATATTTSAATATSAWTTSSIASDRNRSSGAQSLPHGRPATERGGLAPAAAQPDHSWALKKNVDVVHRADRLDWRLIKVN